jgi:WS/DGAT/MGAT family acyltransferase
MDYLSPLDAGFLDAEDADKHASLAIASVVIVAGPAPSQEKFIEAVSARLPSIPRYRHRIRTVPLDLGRPVWVDSAQFDLAYHVRRTALPAPGDEAALARLVGRVMSQRLDRDRPLWECWVVEGLAGGRWAVMVKVHHCMVDGVAGNQLLGVLFDDAPKPTRTSKRDTEDDWHPAAEPSTFGLTLRAVGNLLRSPADQVRLLAKGLHTPVVAAHEVRDVARGLVGLVLGLLPGTRSSLSGPIGQQRRYYVARASLPDVIAASKTFKVTVNDIVLAAISGGLRAVLLHRDEIPAADAVRTLVPVSVRAKGDEGVLENQISMMLPLLPVDIADPVERLDTVHTRLAELKAGKVAQAGAAVASLARQEPFAPLSWALRFAFHVPQRTIVAVTTNVPGPRQPLYVLGRQILEILPYAPIALRMRTGVAALSYCDQLTFGISSDYDSAPEVELLGRAIADGINELVQAARAMATAPATTQTAAGRPARKRVRAAAGTVAASPKGRRPRAAQSRPA